MTDAQKMCCVYEVLEGGLEEGWEADFIRENLLAVMKVLEPDAYIRFEVSDDLHRDPREYNLAIVNYVRVEHGDPDFSADQNVGGSHYFIFRQSLLIKMTSRPGMVSGMFPPYLMFLWDTMAQAIRRFLQKSRKDVTRPVPFSALSAHGVPLNAVVDAQHSCIGFAQSYGIVGDESLRFMDSMTVGIYVGTQINEAIQWRDSFTPADVAKWVQI